MWLRFVDYDENFKIIKGCHHQHTNYEERWEQRERERAAWFCLFTFLLCKSCEVAWLDANGMVTSRVVSAFVLIILNEFKSL